MIGTRPARPLRSRALLAALGLTAVCLLAALATAAPSLAAGKKGGHRRASAARIKVLSPRPEARVGGTLDARIRVSTASDFSASLAGHDVTARFHRHGSMLEAHLRRGRDFDLGRNNLLIAAGNGPAMRATTVHFFSRSHAQGLLAVARLDPHSGRTPLRFRISVAAPVAQLEVTINHHRYPVGPVEARRSWTIAVGAGDGLRYGHNVLRAAVERVDGKRFDRESVNFNVSHAAPLVSAGPDRLTRPGRGVVLDGGATQGARQGALLYRWKIVKKPRGSHAGVVAGTGRQARLMPDLPGSYRLRLVAARANNRVAAEDKTATAAARASDATGLEPTCLPNIPVDLIPAGTTGGGSAGADPLQPLSPLAAPVCVTPTGETSAAPLPVAELGATAADEMEVLSRPTLSPMGLPIETIASDGSVRIGPQVYPKGSGFAHLLILDYETLELEKQEFFPLSDAEAMKSAVEGTSPKQIVVLTGMDQAQGQPSTQAEEALAKSITALHGYAPPAAKLAAGLESGRWSVIGSKGQAVQYASNLFAAAEQEPVEASTESLPGSLNGHMQTVKSGVYTYVSAEFVPIDTRASGSTPTLSVFKVGEESVSSKGLPQGWLGLHLAVFNGESSNGKLTAVSNETYVLDYPYSNTNVQGVKEAAEYLKHWREAPGNDLIVMQTFGEETVSPKTAPWGAPNWVNDGLLHHTATGLFEWNGQPYVNIKKESEAAQVLDGFWNPGYPTVAGQVGDLTGPAGHDLIANFGAGNPQIEVSRLTMVAANHALNPEANFISGTATTSNGTPEGRLVGTLTRNAEAGWTVQNASSAATFKPSKIWEMAYAEPTAWPLSESREDKEAMLGITRQIYGRRTAITNLRDQYASDTADEIQSLETELTATAYEPTKEYSETTYNALHDQLLSEIRDVYAVKVAINQWKSIYGSQSTDQIQVGNVSSRITKEVIHNAAKEKETEVEVNAEAIIAESLYTVADLVGFPEVYAEIRLPEIFGMIAGGVALAEAASPEPADAKGPEGPESALIRAEADEIGTKLAENVEAADDGLRQLEEILVSDWGKLSAAAPEARENWKIEKELEGKLKQSLTIDTERELYEGLLPTAFKEWVVAPWDTYSNPSGPQTPGKTYACLQYKPAYEDEETKHPFKDEPAGGLSTGIYRPWSEPGSSTAPAVPYTVPYGIRALKSTSDSLKLKRTEFTEDREAVTVSHDGSSPKAGLVEKLFEPVLNGESVVNPSRLGINKTEFFGKYGGGPGNWGRAICAQQ